MRLLLLYPVTMREPSSYITACERQCFNFVKNEIFSCSDGKTVGCRCIHSISRDAGTQIKKTHPLFLRASTFLFWHAVDGRRDVVLPPSFTLGRKTENASADEMRFGRDVERVTRSTCCQYASISFMIFHWSRERVCAPENAMLPNESQTN